MWLSQAHTFRKKWRIRCSFCISCIVNWLWGNDPSFWWVKKVIFAVFCMCFLHHFKKTYNILKTQFSKSFQPNSWQVASTAIVTFSHCNGVQWDTVCSGSLKLKWNCSHSTALSLQLFAVYMLGPWLSWVLQHSNYLPGHAEKSYFT